MKNKSKYLPSLILTSITVFGGVILSSSQVGAATDYKTASVTVVPACYFTNEGDGFTTNLAMASGVSENTENLTKDTFTFTCGSSTGFSIQAVGFSPESAGGEGVLGNTDLYSTVDTIPTGTSGTDSHWAFRISSASSSHTYTIQSDYGHYSSIPSIPTDIIVYPGALTPGTAVTGTMRTDYEVYASGDQAPATYTGAVKYILAVNS